MTTKDYRICKSTLALAVTAAFLAGCGGGGGDDGPPGVEVPTATRTVAASAGSDANADNLLTLGGWLARSVMSVSGDDAFDITRTRESPQRRPVAGSAVTVPLHARMVLASVRLAAPSVAAREQPLAVASETLPCENGGSITFTVDDADNNEKLSGGDSVTLSATNCVLETGLPATDGDLGLVINAVELDSDQMPTALDASATFTAFAVDDYGTYDGAMRLWTKPEGANERSRVSYRDTRVTTENGTVVFNFDVYGLGDGVSSTFDLNGGLTIEGQTYSVVSSGVMTAVGTNPPASGLLQLRDFARDAAQLTAKSVTTFDLAFLPVGATVPTASLPGLFWSDYVEAP